MSLIGRGEAGLEPETLRWGSAKNRKEGEGMAVVVYVKRDGVEQGTDREKTRGAHSENDKYLVISVVALSPSTGDERKNDLSAVTNDQQECILTQRQISQCLYLLVLVGPSKEGLNR